MPHAPTEIRSLARKHTNLAIRVLKQIAACKTAPDSSRVAAATALLDRGWGKPEQQVEVTAKIADQMSDAELNAEIARLELAIAAAPIAIEDHTDPSREIEETQH